MLRIMIMSAVALCLMGCRTVAQPPAIVLAIEPGDAPHNPADVIDWDVERKEPMVIVIHHTGDKNPLDPKHLSEAGLEHAYAPVFQNGNKDPYVAPGTEPYSGHYVMLDGKPVETFALYHVYINPGGERTVYLSDKAIGWHAGNWAVNVESLAIVLEGDFTATSPPEKMLDAAALQIAQWCLKYPSIRFVAAHREVRKTSTICPGEWFFQGGAEQLIDLANGKAGKDLGLSRNYPKRVR